MISGSPPTERNARTGLLTPPTRTFLACSKISRERRRSLCTPACVALMSAPLLCLPSGFQPARRILRVIGKDDAGASALNSSKNLHDHAPLVHPIVQRGGLDHGVFATDIVGRDRHIELFA